MRCVRNQGARGRWLPKLLTFVALLPFSTPALHAQKVTAVAHVDEARLSGTWYEIARYPIKREKHCDRGAFELVAPGDKKRQLKLVDSCVEKTGYVDVKTFNANSADKSGGGKYKVRTFWPFSRKYWVLAVGPYYEWSLVGSPNHKELWVFSKERTLAPDVLTQVEALAAAQGFPSSKLVAVPQPPPALP